MKDYAVIIMVPKRFDIKARDLDDADDIADALLDNEVPLTGLWDSEKIWPTKLGIKEMGSEDSPPPTKLNKSVQSPPPVIYDSGSRGDDDGPRVA